MAGSVCDILILLLVVQIFIALLKLSAYLSRFIMDRKCVDIVIIIITTATTTMTTATTTLTTATTTTTDY
jgi:hypothetical protein